MLNFTLKELELKAKNRGIKGYKSTPIDKLLSIFDKSVQVKKKVIRDIRKEDFSSDQTLKSIKKLFSQEKHNDINDEALKDIRSLY